MDINSSFTCKIADLVTEIPDEGGLAPLCGNYLFNGDSVPDIIINPEKFRKDRYLNLDDNDIAYMEAAVQFYSKLLDFDGFYLHSSAVELDGQAFLFSGHCGAGKSTHTGLWQQRFGDKAHIFNDDKPALRLLDGRWYAYGTPFSGKNHININTKVPLAGICFLKQADSDRIRRLSSMEAVEKILSQTFHKFKRPERLDKMLTLIDRLVCDIPVFELENRPTTQAVDLSYNTMLNAAKEVGL